MGKNISNLCIAIVMMMASDAFGGERRSYSAMTCLPHRALDMATSPLPAAISGAYQVHGSFRLDNATYYPVPEGSLFIATKAPEVVTCPLGNSQAGLQHSIRSVVVYAKTGIHVVGGMPQGLPFRCLVLSNWINDETGEVELLDYGSDQSEIMHETIIKLTMSLEYSANWGVYSMMCRMPPADSDLYSYTVELDDQLSN